MATTETVTKTIYTFESSAHTWYVDYTENHERPYQVCEDVIARASFRILDQALEYIMRKVGHSNWKIK